MDPPKYRISGTISALEKRNKILEDNKLDNKLDNKFEPNIFQIYFKKKMDAGFTPQEAKKITMLYKKYKKKRKINK